jgi:hypothetical protein
LVAASVGLARTPFVDWCFAVTKPAQKFGTERCVLISGGMARQDWLPGGLLTPF